jgi:hypothetical protein
VDTPEDYDRARQLYNALSALPPETRFSGERIISVFDELFPPGNGENSVAAENNSAVNPGAGR